MLKITTKKLHYLISGGLVGTFKGVPFILCVYRPISWFMSRKSTLAWSHLFDQKPIICVWWAILDTPLKSNVGRRVCITVPHGGDYLRQLWPLFLARIEVSAPLINSHLTHYSLAIGIMEIDMEWPTLCVVELTASTMWAGACVCLRVAWKLRSKN